MSRRFDLAERPIQLQEHFLRDLFSAIPIVQEVPRNAEDHVLVLADQSTERFVIAGRRVLQRGIESTEQEWSRRAHLRLYTRKSGERMQSPGLIADVRRFRLPIPVILTEHHFINLSRPAPFAEF